MSKRDLRIVFMGTPEFAVGVLKEIIESGKKVVGVITAPDRPAGRGRKLMSSAVKEYAISKDIEVLQPVNLKDKDFLADLRKLNANLQVVVAFRMLPKAVWQMPEFGTFNLHASLLPQYRGAAPINWAIINGEEKTGVTTFFIDEKIDTGEIIANSEICIDTNETAGSLHDKLMTLGGNLVLRTLDLIEEGNVKPIPQENHGNLKDAPKLTPENTKLDWSKSGKKIEAMIKGLSPYPVAWCYLNNNGEKAKVKIFQGDYVNEEHTLDNGSIIATKKELKVSCSDGYIYLKELQIPGKRKMDVASLLNGYRFENDAELS